MNIGNTIRIVGFAAVVAAMPAILVVAANAQAPAPATEAAPGAVRATPPLPSTAAPQNSGAAASVATVKNVTIGAAVIGSDGQAIGEIKGVKSDPAGKVEEIHVKTGGILGFGGKVVVIPAGKIAKGGKTVEVALTAADIGKMPALTATKG